MINYLSKNAAVQVAQDYQWLIGHKFLPPYSTSNIDFVKIIKQDNGLFQIVCGIDAFEAPAIPEFYGFKSPSVDLFTYLKVTGINYL
jgi:hypothetical protein